MKRETSVGDQIYRIFYPNPKPDDHPSWDAVVRKELAKEARHESRMFYGDDWGNVMQQPGVDYSGRWARTRLKRFPWHKKLFDAFDQLNLTESEIYNLCTWDCTKHALDVAQAANPGMKLGDDTGDDIPTWEEVQAQREQARRAAQGYTDDESASMAGPSEQGIPVESDSDGFTHVGADPDVDMDDEEDEVDEMPQMAPPMPPLQQGTHPAAVARREHPDVMLDAPASENHRQLILRARYRQRHPSVSVSRSRSPAPL